MASPALFLQAQLNSVTQASTTTIGGTPTGNTWNASMALFPQTHSDPTTVPPNSYDGTNIEAGNYFCNTGGGSSYLIKSVTSKTASTANVVLEDVGNVIAKSDNTGAMDGTPLTGSANKGFIFRVKNGLPVLSSIPTALPGNLPLVFLNNINGFFAENVFVASAGGGLTPEQTAALANKQDSTFVTDVLTITPSQGYIGTNGSLGDAGDTSLKHNQNYIPCLPTDSFQVDVGGHTNTNQVSWYGPGNVFISGERAATNGGRFTKTVTPPANAESVRFTWLVAGTPKITKTSNISASVIALQNAVKNLPTSTGVGSEYKTVLQVESFVDGDTLTVFTGYAKPASALATDVVWKVVQTRQNIKNPGAGTLTYVTSALSTLANWRSLNYVLNGTL